jgi:hypothetical protein
MFAKLAGFRPFESRDVASPRRFAPGRRRAMHSNDNLLGFRRPAGQCRSPKPALACHWYSSKGRLQCYWQADANNETPSEDLDQLSRSTLEPLGGAGHWISEGPTMDEGPSRPVANRLGAAQLLERNRT